MQDTGDKYIDIVSKRYSKDLKYHQKLLKEIPHTVISKGRKSDYFSLEYDEEYTLISGNY